MYAIFQDGGKQYKVAAGDVVDVEIRPEQDTTGQITFDQVLMIGGEDTETRVGTPVLDGVAVTGTVVEETKGDKIDVVKFKRRKGYRVKQGHRQKYLRVRIDSLGA